MFKQVVATLFDLMIDFEYLWKYVGPSRPSSIYGFGQGMDQPAPAVNVSTDKLFASFKEGWKTHGELWREVIPAADFRGIEEMVAIESEESFTLPSELWARIIFNFAVAYRNTDEADRDELMEALIPFYHSRVLAFVNDTRDSDDRAAEDWLDRASRVFEAEKYYLIDRWDHAKSVNGRLFV
jgi:hypothetical protein